MLESDVPGIKIAAPAKLNLHLRVGDRRPDGFHDIESLFLALDFGDTVLIETRPGTAGGTLAPAKVNMDWQIPGENLPPEKNIVSGAVSLFRSRTGYAQGLEVTVEKRIPLGGGLGGGSSDAAATLLALNRLAAPDSPDGDGLLDREALAEMGAELGSDVPFFVHSALGGFAAAWVGGRGEQIRPVELPGQARGLSLLLVNPGFHSDTARAFGAVDRYRRTAPSDRDNPDAESWGPEEVLARPPGDWPFRNDFMAAFAGQEADSPFYDAWRTYREIIFAMKEAGADFAGLSGSGSTCFGVFSVKDKATLAKKILSKQWPYIFETFACTRGSVMLKWYCGEVQLNQRVKK